MTRKPLRFLQTLSFPGKSLFFTARGVKVFLCIGVLSGAGSWAVRASDSLNIGNLIQGHRAEGSQNQQSKGSIPADTKTGAVVKGALKIYTNSFDDFKVCDSSGSCQKPCYEDGTHCPCPVQCMRECAQKSISFDNRKWFVCLQEGCKGTEAFNRCIQTCSRFSKCKNYQSCVQCTRQIRRTATCKGSCSGVGKNHNRVRCSVGRERLIGCDNVCEGIWHSLVCFDRLIGDDSDGCSSGTNRDHNC